MDITLGICGCIGGLLCAIGDILLDFKGKDNTKLGHMRMIESNWLKMSEWRFRYSILLAALGVPLYFLGFLGMSHQLAKSNETLASIFFIFAIVGSTGCFFIHTILCCFPIIYKTLDSKGLSQSIMELLVEKIYNAIKIPFMIMFVCIVVGTSIILMIAIGSKSLNVPAIFFILNPLILMMIGWIFRLFDKEKFADLPGIMMPSLGISMIGVMTILSETL